MKIQISAILTGVLLGAPLAVMLMDRDNPAVINQPVVINSTVKPGELLRLKIEGYRTRTDCSYTEVQEFQSSDMSKMQFALSHQGHQLGHFSDEKRIKVPLDISPGEATLFMTYSFECGLNPIHSFWPIRVGPIKVNFTIKD